MWEKMIGERRISGKNGQWKGEEKENFNHREWAQLAKEKASLDVTCIHHIST